ncbi:hypothetical protein [Paracoccus isoporae]|uniref:hypothetical protein n=1 Tax=Paracoccus isoporae TaxID=591205 RepID=UPI000B86D38B|nr:hypothetical protein [Paracoccus isoporae]
MCLFLPFSVFAEPAITVSDGPSGIAVSVSGLDPDRTYWLTIVSPDAEDGAYTSFEYLSGSDQGAVAFPDPGPGQPMELRLHEKSAGNPLLARALLDAPAEAAIPVADARLVDFARIYGLAGDWRGEMACAQGTAAFEVTLRPHFYENGYLGDLRLTLIDGPDQGASGEWPLTVQHRPDTGAVSLAADSPRSVPVEGYAIPQIFGTTLSEDGLRVEDANLQSQSCTSFSFARAPLPAPENALAEAEALRTDGFLGQWQGSYDCGAPTALDLIFEVSPVNDLTLARWVYRGTGKNAFDGEALFRAQAAGPGQIGLMPLKWVKQPYRHQVAPVTFSLAPDGAAMQGEFAGCGPVQVTRVGGEAMAGAATQVMSDAERAGLADLAGRWSGLTPCGGTEQFMQIDLPDLSAGETGVDLRYAASKGVDAGAHLALAARPGDPIELSLIEKRQAPLNQPIFLPRELARADGGLVMQFDETCDDVALRRDDPPPRFAALPGATDQQALLVQESDKALRVAAPATICRTLADWAAALSPAEARMTRAGTWVTHHGGWPVLFTDPYFQPVFGMGYPSLSASPDVGEALLAPLRTQCGDLGVEDLQLRTALTLAFGVARNSELFGSEAQRFRLAVDRAQVGQDRAARLAEDLAALPDTPDARERIAALRTELETLALLDSETARLTASLDAAEARIVAAGEEAFLTALAAVEEPATPKNLGRAVDLLQQRDPAERSHWIEQLDRAAGQLAERIDAGEMQLAGMQDLAILPPIAAALEKAEEKQRRADAAAKSALRERIAGLGKVTELRPVLTAITDGGNDPGLLAAYDAKARALLVAAAGPIPDAEAAEQADPEPALSGGALSGLRRNALITAFLTGDPLVPYRADRDSTLRYLQRMVLVFRDYCPAALPPDLQTRIAGQFVDVGALTGSRDQMAAMGLQAIVEGLGVLADPGSAMAGAIRQDEIFAMADGDAQILLRNLDCTGPDMRRLFENARDYVIDPAKNVPQDRLGMAEICLVALDDGMVMNETRAYCRCAGDQLDRSSAELQAYLRADPRGRYRQIPLLDRALDQALRGCRQ